MTEPLDLAAHLEGLRAAVVTHVREAHAAGADAPVPTTPDWTVRRLVAHQGMVHRWARAIVRGDDAATERSSADRWEGEGLRSAEPLDWLLDGAVALAAALSEAPEDLDALVFLADAPRPREFWARRQCHESTVHAVDALSARLGRYPEAADAAWIGDAVALDGIDELLTGFVPRPVSRLRADHPTRILVRPDGTSSAWLVEVGERPPVTTRWSDHVDVDVDADVLLTGAPVALYLTLWNRSDEAAPAAGWDLWRDSAQVRWSR